MIKKTYHIEMLGFSPMQASIVVEAHSMEEAKEIALRTPTYSDEWDHHPEGDIQNIQVIDIYED